MHYHQNTMCSCYYRRYVIPHMYILHLICRIATVIKLPNIHSNADDHYWKKIATWSYSLGRITQRCHSLPPLAHTTSPPNPLTLTKTRFRPALPDPSHLHVSHVTLTGCHLENGHVVAGWRLHMSIWTAVPCMWGFEYDYQFWKSSNYSKQLQILHQTYWECWWGMSFKHCKKFKRRLINVFIKYLMCITNTFVHGPQQAAVVLTVWRVPANYCRRPCSY